MTREIGRSGAWLDGAVLRLYTRHRRRFIWILVALTAVGIECVVPVLVLALGPVYSNSFHVGKLMAVLSTASLLGIPSLYLLVRVHHGPAIAYLRGDSPPPSPEDVWRTSVAELALGVFLIGSGYWVPLTAGAVSIAAWQGKSLLLTLSLVYAVAVGCGLSGAFFYLLWEQALRPLARELAPQLPTDVLSRTRGPSISAKLFAILVLISLFNGFVVGAVTLVPSAHTTRVLVAAVASVAVSVVLGASVIWLFRRSFVTRIDEIRGALDQVQAGIREGVALAPLAADELDEVTSSFNGMVLQLAQREDDMRASRARIVTVADEERRRMERDLHDGAQQFLSLMRLQVAGIKRTIQHGSGPVDEQLDELSATVDEALNELRNLAHGIYPATLETEGIRSALEEAARRAVIPTVVDGDDVPRLARESEAAIYFCCLEALQNAGKHAGPDATATLTLRTVDHRIEFEVTDTGVGFDPQEAPSSGLTNMSDRIGAVGGQLSVSSSRGGGTVVRGWTPALPATG